MPILPTRSIRALSRHWTEHLAPYRHHRNDEHREALIVEALRYAGFALEADLAGSSYWSEAPLSRRAALLLYLVDRRAVVRSARDGRIVYEVTPDADAWAAEQTALAPYLTPTLELIDALRAAERRRTARDVR